MIVVVEPTVYALVMTGKSWNRFGPEWPVRVVRGDAVVAQVDAQRSVAVDRVAQDRVVNGRVGRAAADDDPRGVVVDDVAGAG